MVHVSLLFSFFLMGRRPLLFFFGVDNVGPRTSSDHLLGSRKLFFFGKGLIAKHPVGPLFRQTEGVQQLPVLGSVPLPVLGSVPLPVVLSVPLGKRFLVNHQVGPLIRQTGGVQQE